MQIAEILEGGTAFKLRVIDLLKDIVSISDNCTTKIGIN